MRVASRERSAVNTPAPQASAAWFRRPWGNAASCPAAVFRRILTALNDPVI